MPGVEATGGGDVAVTVHRDDTCRCRTIAGMPRPTPTWRSLAVLLAAAGATHLAAPQVYAPLIPRQLGPPGPWVLWSGVAELACAAGLLHPRTRRVAARASAALFVAVFPGNVQMAVSALGSGRAGAATKALLLGRLPLQAPLVRWALRVAREAG